MSEILKCLENDIPVQAQWSWPANTDTLNLTNILTNALTAKHYTYVTRLKHLYVAISCKPVSVKQLCMQPTVWTMSHACK